MNKKEFAIQALDSSGNIKIPAGIRQELGVNDEEPYEIGFDPISRCIKRSEFTQKTIIAMNNDPQDEFCLGIIVEITEKDPRKTQNFNVISALQKAAREFAKTDAGVRVMERTGMNFNWGDLAEYLPDEFCERHGVRIVDTFQTDLVVSHNEPLVF